MAGPRHHRLICQGFCTNASERVYDKDQKSGSLTQRVRGSSAMAGWAEWVIGLHRQSESSEDPLRWAEFELKAASARPKIYFSITSDDTAQTTVVRREDAPEKPQRKRGGIA